MVHRVREAIRQRLPVTAPRGWRASGWIVALTAVAALALCLIYGFVGYRSLTETDVLRWAWLPALMNGVILDVALGGAVLTLLWWPGRFSRALTAAILLGLAIIETVQVLSVYFSSGFLSVQALAHVELAWQLATPASVAIAVVIPVGLMVTSGLLVRATGLTKAHVLPRTVAAVTLLTLAWFSADSARVDALARGLLDTDTAGARKELTQRYGMVAGSPVAALVGTLREAGEREVIRVTPPTATQLAVAAKYGLQLDPAAAFPLVHPRIYRQPFAHPSATTAPAKANVIVIFAESLSSHLLESYGGQHRGLTPNLSAMAARSLQVDDWFNHVTPTVTGLRGQLCGLWPRLSYTPWHDATQKLRTAKVFCLPHLLAEQGWHTMYWSHSRPHDTYIKAQAIDWGFQELYFHGELSQRMLGETVNSRQYGVTDRQMMRALTKLVATPRSATAPPFFLAVSTIETHTGFDVGKDGKRYRRGKKRSTILDTFHNLDDAFGDFWRAFLASPRAKDTIVIVTADHALYPSDGHRAVAGRSYLNHKFGRAALLIYDPTHTLPSRLDANTTSVDFAPTIAHLLGVQQRETPWLGHSIFGDRQAFSGALGFIYSKHLLTIDAAGPHIDSQPKEEAAALRAVLAYTQGLEAQGRIWR